MTADGILFAPFELAITESGAGDSFRCIDAANHAASAALGSRYALKTTEPYATRTPGASWEKGPGGRVAVHVEAVRCGLVVANPTYARFFLNDPASHELMAAGLGLQLVGYLIIRKIVTIEV